MDPPPASSKRWTGGLTGRGFDRPSRRPTLADYRRTETVAEPHLSSAGLTDLVTGVEVMPAKTLLPAVLEEIADPPGACG